MDTSSAHAQVVRQPVPGREPEVFVYITEQNDGMPPDGQTLLFDLLCSNGVLSQGLRLGDINRVNHPFEHVTCQNITAVTQPAPVPMGEDLRQRLVSHLALTQLDLATAQGLHESLDLYNLHALTDEQVARAHRLILEGLLEVNNEERRFRVRGIPIRGRATTVEIGEAAFSSEGELYLFGCVLNEFIALQTPLNWFSELSIRWNKTKRHYRWPKRLGTVPLTD
jgi:type VI secretion system protein ImpG